MPFTLAHAAAALPFRRMRLVPSALVVGAFAPDFEYFLQLAPTSGYGHRWPGVFLLTLPVSMAVLVVFHAFVKAPAVALLPEGLQRRLACHLGRFRFFGLARCGLILISLLVGIATHIVWDSFTHRGSWLYGRWAFLGQRMHWPVLGEMPYYKVFQHGSTILGMAILCVWFAGWYRRTESCHELRFPVLPAGRRWLAIALVVALALTAGLGRAAMGAGWPHTAAMLEGFAGQAVCTFIAAMWWELVAYGVFNTLWRRSQPRAAA